MAATGQINYSIFATQKVIFNFNFIRSTIYFPRLMCFLLTVKKIRLNNYLLRVILGLVIYICKFTVHFQRLLVSSAQSKLIPVHHQLVSGHTHDMPSQEINIIWSHVLMDIHVWFHAVKVPSSTNTHWLVKNFKKIILIFMPVVFISFTLLDAFV